MYSPPPNRNGRTHLEGQSSVPSPPKPELDPRLFVTDDLAETEKIETERKDLTVGHSQALWSSGRGPGRCRRGLAGATPPLTTRRPQNSTDTLHYFWQCQRESRPDARHPREGGGNALQATINPRDEGKAWRPHASSVSVRWCAGDPGRSSVVRAVGG
jgi:hypothetical protein